MAKKDDVIEMEGRVLEVLPNTQFIVKLDNDFAIIESKVYLNRTDPEDAYVSCAMAQRWRSDDDNYGKNM